MSAERIVIGGTDVTDLVEEQVAAAPPLSAAQFDQLYLLLQPMREAIARDAAESPKQRRRAA